MSSGISAVQVGREGGIGYKMMEMEREKTRRGAARQLKRDVTDVVGSCLRNPKRKRACLSSRPSSTTTDLGVYTQMVGGTDS